MRVYTLGNRLIKKGLKLLIDLFTKRCLGSGHLTFTPIATSKQYIAGPHNLPGGRPVMVYGRPVGFGATFMVVIKGPPEAVLFLGQSLYFFQDD